jgi:3D (Asp-Asp-Asp) domain-containing protein
MLTNRIICMLSVTLLFTFPTESNISPFQTTQVVVKENEGMVLKTDKYGLLINPIQEQVEKDRIKIEKNKAEELKLQKEKEIQEQKKEPQWQEFTLTFYSSMNSENGFGNKTCQNKPLSRGGVANNVIPQNTQIYLEGYGQVIVNDKGSNKHFAVDTRLDVYIEREDGESDREYSRRISKLGVQKVKGYIIK